MALTTQANKNFIVIACIVSIAVFNTTYKAGSHSLHSGIYKCSKCGREIAFNKDDNPLPPHYSNNSCRSPEWKLFIYAQN
mgnify:FL=1